MGATWQGDKRARKYEREREDGGRASEQVQNRERGKGHRHLNFVPLIAMPQDTIRLVCRDPTYLCELRAQCVVFVLG